VPSIADAPLFVPGNRPDKFGKAVGSGATHVILDLEDAVGNQDKEAARTHIATWPGTAASTVRINTIGTPDGDKDLCWLRGMGSQPSSVLVAEVESAMDIDAVASATAEGTTIVALIESARGMNILEDIANHPRVDRIAFGGIDFALDLGCSSSSAVIAMARATIVTTSRVAGLERPWDAPTLDFKNLGRVAHDARQAKDDGFAGKLCIHPAQVAVVLGAFEPTIEEVTWARRVVGQGDDASQLDGAMIDRPVIERAHSILAAARPREGTR
jgi:citrate lyase subunit beta/citryl-CoA lyase